MIFLDTLVVGWIQPYWKSKKQVPVKKGVKCQLCATILANNTIRIYHLKHVHKIPTHFKCNECTNEMNEAYSDEEENSYDSIIDYLLHRILYHEERNGYNLDYLNLH